MNVSRLIVNSLVTCFTFRRIDEDECPKHDWMDTFN